MLRPISRNTPNKGFSMRLFRLAVASATLACLPALALIPTAALAQTGGKPAAPVAAPAPTTAKPADAKPVDSLLAKVNGAEIHMSDLSALAQSLPDEARNMPPQQLLPMLLEQAVDGKALVALARKQNLDRDPLVARSMVLASERALQSALVSREVGPTVNDTAIRARYDSDVAGKPGEEEVRARHILVATEEQAKKLIAEIKAGADFATVAKSNSTDPGAAQGGDLGFFKATDMLPEFSAAAFALKPGDITEAPVQTRYGWHVIKLEERRNSAAPSFEQAYPELRQALISDGINKVLAQARTLVKVERFNQDGSPMKPTDTATPPAKK
jgi:peptidyl-prolyl cis-trans isomerase C